MKLSVRVSVASSEIKGDSKRERITSDGDESNNSDSKSGSLSPYGRPSTSSKEVARQLGIDYYNPRTTEYIRGGYRDPLPSDNKPVELIIRGGKTIHLEEALVVQGVIGRDR